MAANSLKEYLVKLGWSVDESGFSNAMNKIGSFEGKTGSMASKISGNFLTAGAAVFSFITSTTLAIGKLLSATAEADLATERFARRMWTSEENARSFLSALDAMDAEFSDIFYMTPEEYNRFMSLKDLGASLQAPEGLQDTLKLVRDIGFEFDRLKVIGNYATQWVSFYLGKYMGEDLTKIREGFKSFNDWLISKIPVMTEKVAKFLSMIFRLGKSATQGIEMIINAIVKLWNGLSTGAKNATGAIVALVGLLKMGPIGAFIATLSLLLILLDDFLTWQRGGKSAFPEMWEKLNGLFESLDKERLNDFGKSVDDLLSSVWDLFITLLDAGGEFVKFLDDIGAIQSAFDILDRLIGGVADGLQLVSDLIKIIMGDINKIKGDTLIGKLINRDEMGEVKKGETAISIGSKFIDIVSKFKGFSSMPSAGAFNDILNSFSHNGVETLRGTLPMGGVSRSQAQEHGGGAGRYTVTQTNNISVTAAPGESAERTADKTATRIARQRDWLTSFNR